MNLLIPFLALVLSATSTSPWWDGLTLPDRIKLQAFVDGRIKTATAPLLTRISALEEENALMKRRVAGFCIVAETVNASDCDPEATVVESIDNAILKLQVMRSMVTSRPG